MLQGLRICALALGALVGQSIALCQSPAPGIYGISFGNASPFTLFDFSASTGAGTLIAPIDGFIDINAIAFAPNGVLYGFGLDPVLNPDLITINPSNGATSSVAAISGVTPGYSAVDFAIRADGTLFAAYRGNDSIYTISTTTGAATLVGPVNTGPWGLAFSPANTLYMADNTNLYTVNQSTASLTQVAVISFDSNFGSGPQIRTMKFDPVTGKLYAFVYTNNFANGALASINTSTGEVSRIGTSLPGYGGMAIPPSGATGPVSQTITFDTIPNQIFGVSPFPIMARASSGLPMSIVTTTPAVCKAADTLVMLLGAGTCSITASQAGNPSYTAAASVTRSFTVRVAAPSGSFVAAPGSPFSVGPSYAEPASVVGGDFNGDGNRDLAIANIAGNVAVLLGNGSGGFMAATGSPFAVGNDSSFLAVGDFNAGGGLDLAVASESPSELTVLLGNGMGGFATAPGSPFGVGVNPFSVAVGDFNGDGIQDIVTADFSGKLAVLFGNGSGGFTAAPGSPFTAGVDLTSVAVGDFNGDGIQDLAVADSYNNTVTVLFGNGAGGFSGAAGSTYAAQYSPFSVVVGDFNGDGVQDLAVANFLGNDVIVFLGNGSGGFTAAPGSPFAVGTMPDSVVAGDFNGDGIQDLATANSGSNNVTVLLGNGAGGFTAATDSPYTVGSSPQSLTVGDFNGDGIEDLAVANYDSADVTLLLGAVVGLTPQTITFGPLSNVTYGVSPFTISATSSSGMAVTFASSTPAVCTVTGATVTITGVSLCSIIASQLGNATYAAATVAQQFTVNQGPQTIAFATPSNIGLAAGSFAVSATAGSGLAVSFASTTAFVCTVSGTTVTLVAAGTCTIQATQAGNFNYVAATPVSRSFTVFSPCDLKQTGSITVSDVQLIINEALGIAPLAYDLSGTGMANVVDVQIEINAALGLGCAAR